MVAEIMVDNRTRQADITLSADSTQLARRLCFNCNLIKLFSSSSSVAGESKCKKNALKKHLEKADNLSKSRRVYPSISLIDHFHDGHRLCQIGTTPSPHDSQHLRQPHRQTIFSHDSHEEWKHQTCSRPPLHSLPYSTESTTDCTSTSILITAMQKGNLLL